MVCIEILPKINTRPCIIISDMIIRKLSTRQPSSSHGFTIVELLIVIVVIAILAAITTMALNDMAQRSKETAIKSDLRNFATLVEMYHSDNGHYPAPYSPNNDIDRLGFKASHSAYPTDPEWNFEYCTDRLNGNTQYILVVMTGEPKALYVSSNNSTPHEMTISTARPSPPPCYNGSTDSAADEAGLSGIINNPAPGVSGGRSGYTPSGWSDWTQ